MALHRPRSVTAKAATILALYTAAALLAGLVPFARLPGDLPVIAAVVVLVAAFVVGQQLVWAGFWSLFGGLLAAGVFVITTSLGVHASALVWRGVQVQATVTDVRTTHHKRDTTYSYGLAYANGRQVDGRLSEDFDSFDVGDRIIVMVDPDGWVDPETPGEVHAAKPLWIAAGISFFVTALMSLWIGRSRPRGRPPKHGSGGLWYYGR